MKLKLMMLGMSLGALLLSGSNLLNLMGKPSLTSEQYKLLENMCSESKKNAARANDMYGNKQIATAQGNFGLAKYVDGTYSAYVSVDTYHYHVVFEIGTEDDSWKQFDEGQLINSDERLVTSIHIGSVKSMDNKDICTINTTVVPNK